jgi:hypothetical protein
VNTILHIASGALATGVAMPKAAAKPATVYDGLALDLTDRLRKQAERIRARIAKQTQDMLETGRDLAAVKGELEHGQFEVWVKAECGIDPRMARYFMRAAEWYDKECEYRKLVSDMEPSVVIEMAKPSTPTTVRHAVFDRVKAGERVPTKDVRALLADAREIRRKEEEEAKLSARTRKKRAEALAEREVRAEKIKLELEEGRREAERQRKEIAEILVRHLPADALCTVRETLRDKTLTNIWSVSYSSGVMVSPMDEAITAALQPGSAADLEVDDIPAFLKKDAA